MIVDVLARAVGSQVAPHIATDAIASQGDGGLFLRDVAVVQEIGQCLGHAGGVNRTGRGAVLESKLIIFIVGVLEGLARRRELIDP